MTTVPPFGIRIGPLDITGYGIMLMVGFLVGGWLIDRQLRGKGFNREYAGDIVVAAVIGGVVGAKLWYVALHGLDTLLDRGGLVWYGGLVGGALAVTLQGARRGVPFRWTAQLVAPGLAAAYALGRIGCFMVGDDYGVPTTAWWGVKFPQGLPPTTAAGLATLGWQPPPGTDLATVFAVHPTQLFEVVLMTAAFMVLWRLRNRPYGTGWLFGLYLVFAGTERFAIEFIRLKDDRFLSGFTISQLTSVVLVLIGVGLMERWKKAGEAPPGPYLARMPEGRKDGRTEGRRAA
ncbi:MAG TPA: prolipoprotein diacylglyceryl transferase [Gemmatimonadales bacterium]